MVDMTPSASIEDLLLSFFHDRFHSEVPSNEADLFQARILDSLLLVELIMYIEEEFSVRTDLDDLEMENFISISRMAQFIASKRHEAEAGNND